MQCAYRMAHRQPEGLACPARSSFFFCALYASQGKWQQQFSRARSRGQMDHSEERGARTASTPPSAFSARTRKNFLSFVGGERTAMTSRGTAGTGSPTC
jgi:hypothetical protein